jgi:hypothetical protein
MGLFRLSRRSASGFFTSNGSARWAGVVSLFDFAVSSSGEASEAGVFEQRPGARTERAFADVLVSITRLPSPLRESLTCMAQVDRIRQSVRSLEGVVERRIGGQVVARCVQMAGVKKTPTSGMPSVVRIVARCSSGTERQTLSAVCSRATAHAVSPASRGCTNGFGHESQRVFFTSAVHCQDAWPRRQASIGPSVRPQRGDGLFSQLRPSRPVDQ